MSAHGGTALAPDAIAAAATLAALLEASAPKPGNVSPERPFRDMSFEDFVLSAVAIGPVMRAAGAVPVGLTVLRAVEARRSVTPANTNLGIALLLAPLARAAARMHPGGDLRSAVRAVLDDTTVDDAVHAYAAIRLAAPGGLGAAPDADVADAPTIPLTAAMQRAQHRDDVAREYATGYAATFELALPVLATARTGGASWSDAVVQTALTVLAERPDTHIARRAGTDAAARVSQQAKEVLSDGGIATAEGRAALARFDRELRDPSNRLNPGTTADLCAAALFAHLIGREP